MTLHRLAAKFWSALQALRRDQAANVMLTFGLLLVPIVGAVGTAVDYSRANSARTAMQAALDAAALLLGKELEAANVPALNKRANEYFNAGFKRPEAYGLKIDAQYKAAEEVLTLTASGTVDTTVIRVMGMKQIKIDATSTVAWGTSKKLEIALVLDNTGSMASYGKIDALKQASKAFIDALRKANKRTGDIKIAVVPFDTHVNIGPANKTASWIDWTLMDGATTTGTGFTRTSANNYGDADDDSRYDDDRIDKDNWTGCVIDRTQPYDTNDTPPGGNSATWYPAENCNLIPLLPLTDDFNVAKQMLEEMKADGKTNLTIGLVWGWHALSSGMPLTEGRAPAKDIEKHIVFLTDGLNTQNRWTTKPAEIDARSKLVCDNIKAAGIRIFTIRVMEGNQALLQACASSPSMYYNVITSSQMTPVFEEIAKSLYQLRIAR